ncbi:Lrp/AsnC family transcriptional regulator [Marinoscillum pacificum]|uniref:Lrp/AsnC family transcriptional regulator n=1 Tax=Marinoscillum pacificum TaxID=392723 RepID=UPI0021587C42|nr:Lrp/AsnC family transcriptional regulator [Marinoscillum pacificum]
MDSTDIKILKLLQRNAQYTHKEIADKIGLTITPVYERIKRLEKDGTIQRYVAMLDQEQLNLSLVSFTNVSLKEHSKNYIKKFEQEITKIDSVVECYHIAGQYDYMLKIVIKDMKAYQSVVINQLASMENIANVTSSFVMTEVKKSSELPIQ